MAAQLTYLYDLAQEAASNLTVDQITSSIILGAGVTIKGVYDHTQTYEKGDLVAYISEDGVVHVYECTQSGATGYPIDMNYWKEYSLVSKIERLYNNLIVLSATKPADVETNRVWIRAKSDGSGTIDLGDNIGVIILNNFVLSPYEPNPFTPDLVWGKVTSSSVSSL